MEMIAEAMETLEGVVRSTPVLPAVLRESLFFKPESLQLTGSFKIRPAHNQLAHLSQDQKAPGIITSSSGNFAQAVACSAHLLRISAKIVMMESSNPLKVERTRAYGGEVVFCDNHFDARQATVQRIAQSENRHEIYPYDHPLAIAGNATIALEILQQNPTTRNVVVPISGGGLIAGVALGLKLINPRIKVWGIQAAGSNAAVLSFQAGKRVSIEKADTMADGLAVTCPGELTFPLIQEYVDEVATVEEDSIMEAVRHFLHHERLVVEPSGAVTLAAVLEEKVAVDNTVLVLSGGNIDPRLLKAAL
jgi:threonine dehydratase